MDTPYESELSLSPGVNVCVGLRHAFLETTQVPEERPTLPTALHLSLNTSPWRWGHKFNISGGPDRRQQNRRVSVLHFQNEGSTAASAALPIDSFFHLKWRAIWTLKTGGAYGLRIEANSFSSFHELYQLMIECVDDTSITEVMVP